MMPAFTVMFAFFLVGVVGITFHTERDEGTFRRLLASPMSKTALVGGPMLGYMLVIVLQVIFLFAVGAGLFNLEIGNSPLGLLVVTLALGLVVSSMGLLLGTITTTSKQADTIGTLLGFVLPFISGIFITNSLTPGYMQEGFVATIAPFIPHMHAAEGFRLVMSGEGTAEQVLAQVGYLLLFAAIFFVMARWRLKFE
jgi:ABC-2 type transport system permease protein